MNSYQVQVRIVPRKGILDPQGKAVEGALHSLGFSGVNAVHVGRFISLTLDAGSPAEAEEAANTMCRQLLANPVTEDFELQVGEATGS